MKTDNLKALSEALRELNESYSDFLCSMKDAVRGARTAKKLWYDGHKPWLVKLGLALIVFPEPVVSDVLGTLLVAAGTVQEGLRRRALHVEDVPKTFKNVIKELQAVQENINVSGRLG
ncbi:MAG: hypothetical protein QW510_00485 [Candidatus Bathyarchaeia archaeon]